MEEMKKAVISILGEDRKGIIANVTRMLNQALADEGKRLNVQIRVQRSEIFEAMHQI